MLRGCVAELSAGESGGKSFRRLLRLVICPGSAPAEFAALESVGPVVDRFCAWRCCWKACGLDLLLQNFSEAGAGRL